MTTITKLQKTILPLNNWKKLMPYIKEAGEGGSKIDLGIHQIFLEEIGVFSRSTTGTLTTNGEAIFQTAYIRRSGEEINTWQVLLLAFAPTIAIQQYLWGLSNVSVDQVITVLKTTGFWVRGPAEPLTHFLDLLNYAEIISYNKKRREIRVLISPDTPRTPQNIFIDPTRPFSNVLWIKRVLGECKGTIYWLDKHFQKEGLEWLWATANAEKIQEIQILSLDLGDQNLGKDTRKNYKRLKEEMAHKGIKITWSVIDNVSIRDTHDRWIMDSAGYLRNIPNVNAISSGQRSEMNFSDNYTEARKAFEAYWSASTEI